MEYIPKVLQGLVFEGFQNRFGYCSEAKCGRAPTLPKSCPKITDKLPSNCRRVASGADIRQNDDQAWPMCAKCPTMLANIAKTHWQLRPCLQTLTDVCRMWTEIGPVGRPLVPPPVAQIWPKSGRIWSSIGQPRSVPRPSLVESGPSSTSDKSWSIPGRCSPPAPNLDTIGPTVSEPGHVGHLRRPTLGGEFFPSWPTRCPLYDVSANHLDVHRCRSNLIWDVHISGTNASYTESIQFKATTSATHFQYGVKSTCIGLAN